MNYYNTGKAKVRRTAFDLSYEKKFSCDMGQLIPVMIDEVVPSDYFKLGNQMIIRFQPLVAPIMHEIDVYTHYFFVPNRLMMPGTGNDDSWEDFITGGADGDLEPSLPKWEPTTYDEGSLWDYCGFPVDVDPEGAYPVDFPRIAYNMVYNEYYRDENLQDEVALTNEDILNRNWTKDYFTSALPWLQRGTSPALPITGIGFADFTDAVGFSGTGGAAVSVDATTSKLLTSAGTYDSQLLEAMNKNEVDLSTATTFDIADLRLAATIQQWMERNARCGARYVEFLDAHFGTAPKDSRLQRPEYIGGTKNNVIVSEVLQTSQSDTTPQGTLAGKGISVNQGYVGSYRAEEYGVIIGIMSIMPKPQYQQGINRQWLKDTKYDYYFPEFANLSEQAIINAEICAVDGDSDHNTTIFGYQARYDEMRIKPNLTCGQFRDTFDYWHLGRIFNPAAPPELNSEFVTCEPDKRIFAVESDPGVLVQYANLIKAFRPLPIIADPGIGKI
jgi:post-segregation antitoxin (ccd killing protein)